MAAKDREIGAVHERELMSEVVHTLHRLAGERQVSHVEVVLGPAVDGGAARRAWEELVQGTSLERTRVLWEQAQDLLCCAACGHEYAGDRLEVCPYCGGDGVIVEPAPRVALGEWELATTA